MSLQVEYEISQEEIDLLKSFRDIMVYFIDCGYMHNNCGDASKVIQLREFLQISDLTQIPKITYNAAYRAQLTTNVRVDPYVLFAWQRLCEKQTEDILAKKYVDKNLLRDSVERIKKTMFGSINDGIQEIQEILAECGIAFQVVQNLGVHPCRDLSRRLQKKD